MSKGELLDHDILIELRKDVKTIKKNLEDNYVKREEFVLYSNQTKTNKNILYTTIGIVGTGVVVALLKMVFI